jgi:hypothetical protein
MRAMMSVALPGVKGTIMRIGLFGYAESLEVACAWAPAETPATASTSSVCSNGSFMRFSSSDGVSLDRGGIVEFGVGQELR